MITGAPRPRVDAVSRPFWEALAQGRLSVQRCDECGLGIWYPKEQCPRCWSPVPTWIALSGYATLRSHTTIRRPIFPGWGAEMLPYTIGLVVPDELPTVRLIVALPEGAQPAGTELVLTPIPTDHSYPLLAFGARS